MPTVFPAELRRAFVTDLKCRSRRIEVLRKHQLSGFPQPKLLIAAKGHSKSPWQIIKAEPPKLTLENLRQRIEHVQWLEGHSIGAYSLARIADVKIEPFAAEAKTLNAARMARLKAAKRYTPAEALIAGKRRPPWMIWAKCSSSV